MVTLKEKEGGEEEDNSRKELEKVQKALETTKHRLLEMNCLQKMLEKFVAKFVKVEAELGEVRAKMAETKKTNIVEFKESDAYKIELNIIAIQFLAKERLKMK